jgi:hypothetical protein
MVAEDHADSEMNAAAIYNVIRKPLVSSSVSSEYKLPLVYVIDSILKNVKEKFIPVIEKDAKTWMPIVHQALPEEKRIKLKKVWNLWKDAGVFEESKWREMGSCFSESVPSDSSGPVSNATLDNAGITWGVRKYCIAIIKVHSRLRFKYTGYVLILVCFQQSSERWGSAA